MKISGWPTCRLAHPVVRLSAGISVCSSRTMGPPIIHLRTVVIRRATPCIDRQGCRLLRIRGRPAGGCNRQQAPDAASVCLSRPAAWAPTTIPVGVSAVEAKSLFDRVRRVENGIHECRRASVYTPKGLEYSLWSSRMSTRKGLGWSLRISRIDTRKGLGWSLRC